MAYNRWLSSQYSYNSNYDLMHYGRKGMKWGKHVFGLPDINIFSNGTTFNTESLRKLLERGQIDYNRFKELTRQVSERAYSTGKSVARNVSDTWDNFKAGDSADREPEVSKKSEQQRRDRLVNEVTKSIGNRLESEKIRGRTESKRKLHQQQARKDEAERRAKDDENHRKQLEQKRKERESKTKTDSKPTIQNGSKTENPSSVNGYPTGKTSPSAEELLLLALGASATQSEEEKKKRDKERDEKFNKEVEAYQKEQAAKQKKIYEAIGKFLNFAIKVLPGSGAYELAKKLKKK